MTTLLAFLASKSKPYTLQQLSDLLTPLFNGDPDLTVTTPIRPFIEDQHLHFGWPNWGFSAHLESGSQVAEDAEYIRLKFGNLFADGIPTDRIRLGFGLDASRDFTNHIIWVTDALSSIPGVIIYDATQEDLW